MGGELCIDAGAVTFARGSERVALPLSGLRVKLGGAGDRLVFFGHDAHPDWNIYTSDLRVLKAPALLAHPESMAAVARVRGRRRFNRALLLAALALALALPVGLYFSMGSLTALAAEQVPVEWEQKLGQSAFAQYRLQHELLDDERTRAELQQLTAPLTAALQKSPYPFEFHIVRDADLNAFALPGGVVVINSGLIERADNASELLGVLAHEIAHVTERHGVRNIISSAGIVLTAQVLIGDASGVLATIASAAPILLNQSYSRDFERAADKRGVELLIAADIDPRGMRTFFEKVVAQEKKLIAQMGNDQAAEALQSVSRFLSTHPDTEERIARIDALSGAAAAPYRDLEPAFARLRAHLAQPDRSPSNQSSNDNKEHDDAGTH